MNLLTILGACLVDPVFLAALIKNPAVAARRYGFVLTKKELKDLKALVKLNGTGRPSKTKGKSGKRGRSLDDLCERFSRICPVWPCDDYRLQDDVKRPGRSTKR